MAASRCGRFQTAPQVNLRSRRLCCLHRSCVSRARSAHVGCMGFVAVHLLCCLLATSLLSAQSTCAVSGVVVDSVSAHPISGVVVSLSNPLRRTTVSRATGGGGQFALSVPVDSAESQACLLTVASIGRGPVARLVRDANVGIVIRLSELSAFSLPTVVVRPPWLVGVDGYFFEGVPKPGREIVTGANQRLGSDGSLRDALGSLTSNSAVDVSRGEVRLGGARATQTALRIEGIALEGVRLPGLLSVDARAVTVSADATDGGYSGGAVDAFVTTSVPPALSFDISSSRRVEPLATMSSGPYRGSRSDEMLVGMMAAQPRLGRSVSGVVAAQAVLTRFDDAGFTPAAGWINTDGLCAASSTSSTCLSDAFRRRGFDFGRTPSKLARTDQVATVFAKLGDVRTHGFARNVSLTGQFRRPAVRASPLVSFGTSAVPAQRSLALVVTRTDSSRALGEIRQTFGVSRSDEFADDMRGSSVVQLQLPTIDSELVNASIGGPLFRLSRSNHSSAQYSARATRRLGSGRGTLRYSVGAGLFHATRGGVVAGDGVQSWNSLAAFVADSAPDAAFLASDVSGFAGESWTSSAALSWSKLFASERRIDLGTRLDAVGHGTAGNQRSTSPQLVGTRVGTVVSPRIGITLPLIRSTRSGSRQWQSQLLIAAGRFADVPRMSWVQGSETLGAALAQSLCAVQVPCSARPIALRDLGTPTSSWKAAATLEARGRGVWVLATTEATRATDLSGLVRVPETQQVQVVPAFRQTLVRQTTRVGWASATSPWNFDFSHTFLDGTQEGPAYELGVGTDNLERVRGPLIDTRRHNAVATVFYSRAGELRLDFSLRYAGGARFTAFSGNDLNGDGRLNDLPSVPPLLAGNDEWERIAASQSSGAGQCIRDARGRMLRVGECQSAPFFRVDATIGASGRILRARWIRWASIDFLNVAGLLSSHFFAGRGRASLGGPLPRSDLLTLADAGAARDRERVSQAFGNALSRLTQVPPAGIRMNVQGSLWRGRLRLPGTDQQPNDASRRRALSARWPDPVSIVVTTRRQQLELTDRDVEYLLTIRARFTNELGTAIAEVVDRRLPDDSRAFRDIDRRLARRYQALANDIREKLAGRELPDDVLLLLRPGLMSELNRL
jgi:hypothetical protein